MAAAMTMRAQSAERDEFRFDFDRQTENCDLLTQEYLKPATQSETNPGGGVSSQNLAPEKIRRVAPRAQAASQAGGSLLGYVTKDKLEYAVFQFDGAPAPVATLVGWVDSYDYYPDVVVPDEVEYNGQAVPVTAINDYCFYNGWGLTSLTIGNNVSYIGSFSFYNCSYTELSIPEGVNVIGQAAFEYCSLNSIVFENPASLDTPLVIGDMAFAYTKITSIEIPARLELVDDNSFRKSRRNPFFVCSKLESITINPKYHVKNSNRNYTLEIIQGALCQRINADDLYPEYLVVIAYPAARACEEFSLTAPVVDAFAGAFSISNIGRISLTATSEPRTVDDKVSVNMWIGYGAFDISTITELNLSAKGPITLRAPFALNCYNLSNYNLSESITNYKMINGALCAKKDGEPYLVSYPTGRTDQSYTVANDILHLADWCFATNPSIKEITLPSNLKSIGSNAFADCEKLERLIYTGSNLEAIGEDAFYHTNIVSSAPQGEVSLGNWLIGYSGDIPSNLVISENITNAVPGIFRENTIITSVTFPQNFENIPNSMFQNCTNLTTVQFPKNLKTIGEFAFQYAGYDASNSKSRSGELRTLTIPDGVTVIGIHAFDCSRLGEKLILPASLSLLGNYSLSGGFSEVEIHRSTPPETIEGANAIFNSGMINYSTLIIPKDADPLAFTQNPYWNFAKIEHGDFASIEDVAIEQGKIIVSSSAISSIDGEIFTLYATDGRTLGSDCSFSNLTPGIYIVRLGSKVAKYVIH